MSKTGRKPDPDSLQGRMRAYFDAEPHAAVSFAEARVIFNASERSIRHAMAALRRTGMLRVAAVAKIVRADL